MELFVRICGFPNDATYDVTIIYYIFSGSDIIFHLFFAKTGLFKICRVGEVLAAFYHFLPRARRNSKPFFRSVLPGFAVKAGFFFEAGSM